jgi:HAD superfamily hydrolase (TIGR01509 family)
MNRNIKAVLFDLDGVLVDACDWHYQALNRALEEVAHDTIDPQEHQSVFNGLPTKVKLDMLLRAGRIFERDVRRIKTLKQDYTIEIIRANLKPDEKKCAMLRMLRLDGIHTACVTNSIRETADLMLTLTGMRPELEVIISNEDVRNPKPHPEGYWDAMSCFGVLPSETLIVEDSDKGREAARLSGAILFPVANATELTWVRLAEKL